MNSLRKKTAITLLALLPLAGCEEEIEVPPKKPQATQPAQQKEKPATQPSVPQVPEIPPKVEVIVPPLPSPLEKFETPPKIEGISTGEITQRDIPYRIPAISLEKTVESIFYVEKNIYPKEDELPFIFRRYLETATVEKVGRIDEADTPSDFIYVFKQAKTSEGELAKILKLTTEGRYGVKATKRIFTHQELQDRRVLITNEGRKFELETIIVPIEGELAQFFYPKKLDKNLKTGEYDVSGIYLVPVEGTNLGIVEETGQIFLSREERGEIYESVKIPWLKYKSRYGEEINRERMRGGAIGVE